MKEFKIHFDEKEIKNLCNCIDNIRLPKILSSDDWSLGTDFNYLKSLLDYWKN